MAEKAWDHTDFDAGAGTWVAGWNGDVDIGTLGDTWSPEVPIPPGWYDIQIVAERDGSSGDVAVLLEGHTEQDTPATWDTCATVMGRTGGPSTDYRFGDGGRVHVRAVSSQYDAGGTGVFIGPVAGLRVRVNQLTAAAGEGVRDLVLSIRRLKSMSTANTVA